MDLQAEIEEAKRTGSFHRTPRKPPEGAFAAPVTDTANFPDFRVSDVVVINPTATAQPGDFVYIEVRQGRRGKRMIRQYAEPTLGEVAFVPLNRTCATYRAGAGVKIIGKIVELSRAFGEGGLLLAA